jgi:hypothetical protein
LNKENAGVEYLSVAALVEVPIHRLLCVEHEHTASTRESTFRAAELNRSLNT